MKALRWLFHHWKEKVILFLSVLPSILLFLFLYSLLLLFFLFLPLLYFFCFFSSFICLCFLLFSISALCISLYHSLTLFFCLNSRQMFVKEREGDQKSSWKKAGKVRTWQWPVRRRFPFAWIVPIIFYHKALLYNSQFRTAPQNHPQYISMHGQNTQS